jgi:hypothetical protein
LLVLGWKIEFLALVFDQLNGLLTSDMAICTTENPAWRQRRFRGQILPAELQTVDAGVPMGGNSNRRRYRFHGPWQVVA